MGIRAMLTADLRRPPAIPPLPDLSLPVTPHTRHQYITLDGLRGVAAISIVALHISTTFGWADFPNAPLAVDFFLQLSGFIVASAYGSKIVNGMPLASFARRRIGRLYPAFILGLIIGVSAVFLSPPLEFPWTPESLSCNILSNLAMLPQLCGGLFAYPLNPPMWSILFEIVFSFMFFFLARWLLITRNAVAAAVVFGAFTTFVISLYGNLNLGPYQNMGHLAFVRLGLSFLIGVVVYTLHIRVRRTSNLAAVLLMLALAALLLYPVSRAEYQITAVLVAFPAILVTGSIYNPAGNRVNWTLLQLGILSYMLYAIHDPLLMIAIPRVPHNAPLLGVAFLVGVTLLAWVLARTYEPWARAWFDRAFTRITSDRACCRCAANPRAQSPGRP